MTSEDPLKVRWDGTKTAKKVDEVPPRSCLVPADGLLYRALTQRESFIADLDQPDQGLALALAVLEETGRPLSLPEIKEVLVDVFALPSPKIDRALKNIARKLQNDPRIEKRQEAELPSDPEPNPKSKSKAPSAKSTKNKVATSVVRFAWVGATQEPVEAARANAPGDSPGESPDVPSNVERSPSEQLLESLRAPDLPIEAAIVQVSVALVADALKSVEERELAELSERYTSSQRWDLAALLLATPRQSKAVRDLVRKWAGNEKAQDALAHTVSWFVTGSETDAARRVIELLGERGSELSRKVIGACLVAVRDCPQDRLSLLLRLISEVKAPDVEAALDKGIVSDVLLASRNRPLEERFRLLWAAWRLDADALHQKSLWPGQLQISDLESWALRAPEGRLLEDDWIRANVAVPVISEYVRGVERRPGIGQILAWPAVLFDLVDSVALLWAVQRSSANDPSLKHLVSGIAREDHVRDLEMQVQGLRDSARHAQSAAEAARQEAEAARRVEQAASARAAQAEQTQIQAAEREIRQARIDALRALSDLLYGLGRLGPEETAADALQEALAVAARLGLRQIGPVGRVVPYDASRHECLGERTTDQVEIKELGFELDDPDGPLVLRRAAVVSHSA